MDLGHRLVAVLASCLWLLGCEANPSGPAEDRVGSPAGSGASPPDESPAMVGKRPSDLPAAALWTDPPAPSSDPCCDVEQLTGLDDPNRQASPPGVAWNGSGWTVTWGDFDGDQPSRPHLPMLRPLDAGAQPLGGLVAVAGPAMRLHAGNPTALAWDQGRYALVTATRQLEQVALPAQVLLVESTGALQASAGIENASDGGAVTRFPLISGWALVTYDDVDGGVSGQSRLLMLDDQLRRVGREVNLGRTLYADWRSFEVLSMTSRLVVAQATDAGIRMRTFVGPRLDEARAVPTIETGIRLVRAPTSRTDSVLKERTVAAVGAGRLRDTVVVAALNEAEVRTWVYDPFANSMIAGPTRAGTSTGYRTPGVAGEDRGGTAGICYPDGGTPTRDADTLKFALIGPDGAPRGQPVTIASGLRYVAACAVAAGNRDEYLVTLWNAGKDPKESRASILAALVRVRRGGSLEVAR